jgi:hypothetical protein
VVGHERAAGAALCLVVDAKPGAEYEVIDEQLRAVVEQVAQVLVPSSIWKLYCLSAGARLELIASRRTIGSRRCERLERASQVAYPATRVRHQARLRGDCQGIASAAPMAPFGQ